MSDSHLPIQLAARLAGLSPYVIRIWEQRYRAVEPSRTPTKRRLYSQANIDRLRLLREVTHAGHSIGQVAKLSDDKLRELATVALGVANSPPRDPPSDLEEIPRLEECMAAIQSLDESALEETLKRAIAQLGVQGALKRLIAPVVQTVGSWWREGKITVAHERFATNIVRGLLANQARPFTGNQGGPILLVATPTGQLHELGALLAGAMAVNLGWQAIQLGASVPAVEIARVARQKEARAVALSLVYPEDDANLPGELTALREALPTKTALLVGGRALLAYREALNQVGAVLVEDLGQLGQALDNLRKPAGKAKP